MIILTDREKVFSKIQYPFTLKILKRGIENFFIHSKCYNKISYTRYLINNRNLLFIVLGAESLRSDIWGQVKALFQVTDMSLYTHIAEGAREGFFIKALTNPIQKGCTLIM